MPTNTKLSEEKSPEIIREALIALWQALQAIAKKRHGFIGWRWRYEDSIKRQNKSWQVDTQSLENYRGEATQLTNDKRKNKKRLNNQLLYAELFIIVDDLLNRPAQLTLEQLAHYGQSIVDDLAFAKDATLKNIASNLLEILPKANVAALVDSTEEVDNDDSEITPISLYLEANKTEKQGYCIRQALDRLSKDLQTKRSKAESQNKLDFKQYTINGLTLDDVQTKLNEEANAWWTYIPIVSSIGRWWTGVEKMREPLVYMKTEKMLNALLADNTKSAEKFSTDIDDISLLAQGLGYFNSLASVVKDVSTYLHDNEEVISEYVDDTKQKFNTKALSLMPAAAKRAIKAEGKPFELEGYIERSKKMVLDFKSMLLDNCNGTNQAELKKFYRQLSLQYHTDKIGPLLPLLSEQQENDLIMCAAHINSEWTKWTTAIDNGETYRVTQEEFYDIMDRDYEKLREDIEKFKAESDKRFKELDELHEETMASFKEWGEALDRLDKAQRELDEIMAENWRILNETGKALNELSESQKETGKVLRETGEIFEVVIAGIEEEKQRRAQEAKETQEGIKELEKGMEHCISQLPPDAQRQLQAQFDEYKKQYSPQSEHLESERLAHSATTMNDSSQTITLMASKPKAGPGVKKERKSNAGLGTTAPAPNVLQVDADVVGAFHCS